MAKKLKMVFLNSLGKTSTLSPALAAENLTAITVETTMDAVAGLELFSKDNVVKFVTPDNAYYTETIKTQIF